jgi:hypothetical protein
MSHKELSLYNAYSLCMRRVGLAHLVTFPVVELTHPDSNPKFDIDVAFTVESDALLVTGFINLKIKLIQSFEYTHRGRMLLRFCILIGVSAFLHANKKAIYILTCILVLP